MIQLERKNSNWQKLQQRIDETVELVQHLRNEKSLLSEKNKHLERDKKKFAEIKKDMERRITALIEKLKNFEE